MQSIIYIFLALLGLNFLVFIHELGHYIVARRNKMRVEVFSIGFGKPMIAWMRKGVKWQICPFFVGGFVKIAGMEKEGDLEPHEIPNGFYSKKPWARIKVALAGPAVNLAFTLLIFALIWVFGGREKPFSQFTRLIGWMDPKSEFYANGVRPGDELTCYNGEAFDGYQDLIYAALLNGHEATVEGNKIDYYTDVKIPYDYTLQPYESPLLRKGFTTVGVLAPAHYLIYDDFSNSRENALYPHSPMAQSGIQKHDRLIWVDGELVFSQEQLIHMINDGKVLLTVERDAKTFLVKVPRLPMRDIRFSRDQLLELDDWSYEAGIRRSQEEAYFIPYFLEDDLKVGTLMSFVDKNSQITHVSRLSPTSPIDGVLERGDRILAVDGQAVFSGPQLMDAVQKRRIQMIVKRNANLKKIFWKEEDHVFKTETDWDDIIPIVNSIGSSQPLKSNGDFYLLNPVTPIALKDFPFPAEMRATFDQNLKKQLGEAKKIADPEEREKALSQVHLYQSRLMLGVQFQDRQVIYNPSPFTLFYQVFQEITRNLVAFVSGYFSPKYFGGPIFIVQVMKQSWAMGIKEALFWLGAISLNLGILNLLPIPVLDGGHVCFSMIEKIRGKPIKAKTMQRLMIPFVVLLIFVFIYLTYNDLTRIFGRFF